MSLVGPAGRKAGRAYARWAARRRSGRGRRGRGANRLARFRYAGRLAGRGATVARFAEMFRVMVPKVSSNIAKISARGRAQMGAMPEYALSQAGNAGQAALVDGVSDVISQVAQQIFYEFVTPGYQTFELIMLEADFNKAIDEGRRNR